MVFLLVLKFFISILKLLQLVFVCVYSHNQLLEFVRCGTRGDIFGTRGDIFGTHGDIFGTRGDLVGGCVRQI